ncbi:MAG: Asp-tRNA(Asn)/Glu-tRNA(Gln) amidotransferase subunit GatA [Spiribacter salinus]|uniref:Asp-tRNA(Asn)/Glu-tRNA(Gln) amidotransferase subunit GatA n=1 Tax=Spiribacter salinus TaxID=1335746 RepID=A0A540VTV7_9GAMM|nr:MAG: Asp-tRNA(Asn)/Glu-tRNA(Gln) amidotransferase subunit GatA [Spiribacter salinus]
MDSTKLCYLSAGELSWLIQQRQVSPVEVVDAHISRIEATEGILNSFITLLGEQAKRSAARAENEIMMGNYRGPLHGIPLGLKDLFDTANARTTSGSCVFNDFVPLQDSTVSARLKRAGAILLGKLNMHQLAYGPTGENPDYGCTANPWNPKRCTGGSSSGSASATAAGQCTVTMGSDTGGSVRIPAALCGVVGLKPSYGLVSRHGMTPLSWSTDHPGPITRTVGDAALMMNVIAGYDADDIATSCHEVPDYTAALDGEIRGLRVGVLREYFEAPLDAEVAYWTKQTIDRLEEAGASVRTISLPMFEYAQALSKAIVMAEATARHRQLLAMEAEKLSRPVRLRLESGLFLSAADYLKAQQARTLLNKACLNLFEEVDLLAGPTVPVTAPSAGEQAVLVGNQRMDVTATLTHYTRPWNLTGAPAISVPCGFSASGLPIGLQLIGRPFDDLTVLRAAHAVEQINDSRAWPPM